MGTHFRGERFGVNKWQKKKIENYTYMYTCTSPSLSSYMCMHMWWKAWPKPRQNRLALHLFLQKCSPPPLYIIRKSTQYTQCTMYHIAPMKCSKLVHWYVSCTCTYTSPLFSRATSLAEREQASTKVIVTHIPCPGPQYNDIQCTPYKSIHTQEW